MSKPAKGAARAKRLGEQMPLRATRMTPGPQEARDQLMTVGNQVDRGKAAVKAMKAGATTPDRVGPALQKIKEKFGDDAFRQAVKDFQITFRGIDRINLLRNKSPIIE